MTTTSPTKDEQLWMELVVESGCIVCRLFHDAPDTPCEIHHMLSDSHERLGHLYTIGLCYGHHRGREEGKVPRHSPKCKFEEAYDTEMNLLLALRVLILRYQQEICPHSGVHFTLPCLPPLVATKIISHQGSSLFLR